MLIGHHPQQAAFHAAHAAGRLHHAWLLAGPEGVGKRAFADGAARTVLAGAERFGGGEGSQAVSLIAADSHPDFMAIGREALKAGGTAKEIAIHQVRGDPSDQIRRTHIVEEMKFIARLFAQTPAMDGGRVVIVDAVEDMNPSAANAFLKMLEEPPSRTVFLLVSHAPGRLLPTIRSRCRRVRFDPLGEADTRAVIAAHTPDSTDAERDALVALAEGAPGRALRYAGLGADKLAAELDAIAAATPANARARGQALSRALAGKAAQPRYEAFLDLAPRHLAAAARRARGEGLARVLDRHADARAIAESAVGLSLDPAQVTVELARLVAGVDKAA